MAAAVKDPFYHHDQYDQVYDHAAEYVESMESGNEEEEIRVLWRAVFIARHIRAIHIVHPVLPDADGRIAFYLLFSNKVVALLRAKQVKTWGVRRIMRVMR